MKVCPKCNMQFTDEFNFCQNCGTALQALVSSAAKFCPDCGKACDPAENFCPQCGHNFSGGFNYVPDASVNVSLKEFVASYAEPKLKKSVNGAFYALLVFAILNLLLAIFLSQSFPFDGLFLLGMAIWWKLSPGKPCAITTLVYSIVSTLLGLIILQQFTGWLIIITAIYMLSNSKKLTDAYHQFIGR